MRDPNLGLGLYVVRDLKAETLVGNIVHAHNPTPVIRGLADAVNDGKSIVAKNPEDFEVWQIGYLDEETGDIYPMDGGPQRITTALALRTEQQ